MRDEFEAQLLESVRQWVLQKLHPQAAQRALAGTKNAHELLVIYDNWKSRQIRPHPRTLHISQALLANPKAIEFKEPLAQICEAIQIGRNLKRYLSSSTDVISGTPKILDFPRGRPDLDLLLNTWGMHHLHLSTEMQKDKDYVKRTKPLLFAVFDQHDAYLIDILDHGRWAARCLMEILVRDFPASGAFQVLQGAVGLSYEPNEEEALALRTAGVNVPILIDGQVIVAQSLMVATGLRYGSIREADQLLIAIRRFAFKWSDNPTAIRDEVAEAGFSLSADPQFAFDYTEENGAGVVDLGSRVFMPLL